jgi:hypothetical protein
MIIITYVFISLQRRGVYTQAYPLSVILYWPPPPHYLYPKVSLFSLNNANWFLKSSRGQNSVWQDNQTSFGSALARKLFYYTYRKGDAQYENNQIFEEIVKRSLGD